MFCNSFIDAEPNAIDVLIVDEAHRIRETSNNRYTKASLRTGRPQVEELIEAARVPVFLLDEHQVVRPNEVGTVSEIETAAARLDCEVVEVNLNDQFRCGGSRVFEEWVLRLLGLREGGPMVWEGDENFVLDVADAPSPMEEMLRRRLDAGYSARIAAGYCWKWSKEPAPDGTLRGDVVVGDCSARGITQRIVRPLVRRRGRSGPPTRQASDRWGVSTPHRGSSTTMAV